MAPFKAPGLDGFTTCFYQQNWEVVQLEVCNAVLPFLNSGHLDKISMPHTLLSYPKQEIQKVRQNSNQLACAM
jgi:hypothetical protein